MNLNAWFRCSEGCGEQYPLDEIVYRCKRCGELLEVRHDLEALRDRSADDWKELFGRRYMRSQWPYGSGVWGKKEWVNPMVDNDNVVSLFEGGTNLFWADRWGRELGLSDLWIKQCGNAHTASFKDLGLTVLVSQVKQMRAIGRPIRAVACASTGDTSAALAAYCAAAGIPAVVLLPRGKVSIPQLIQPIANGALVLALDTDFDGCMAVVQELTQRPDIYLANSLNSLRIEGQKTVAIEMTQQFDWEPIDWVIIPGGNLGNVTALGLGFVMMHELGLIERLPRICVAQSARANPLYLSYLRDFAQFAAVPAQTTAASAIQIGNPVSAKRAVRTLKRFNGVVEQATEDEIANASAWADCAGLFNCPQTGVALAALVKLVSRGEVKSAERVVVVSTAHGLKFHEWKVNYHERNVADVECKFANPPVELPATIGAVMDAVNARLN